MKNNIYLDNNATTQVAPEVIEAMSPYFSHKWGNPSSIHTFGGKVSKDIKTAREIIADFLNCKPNEIFFTASGSEGDNTALKGFCANRGYEKCRIITTAVEHPAVLETTRYLASKGVFTREIGVDDKGNLNIDEVCEGINENTLVSVMWANNETGVIFPIERITERVRSLGAVMHTDAVQAVGKINVDLNKTPIDMLCFSGHKIHAPKGIGVIFVREGVKIDSLIHGGHQERGFRAGTENVPYIIGLAKACELAKSGLEYENKELRKLRDKLEINLLAKCKGATLNGDKENRLPNTLNISFEYIEGEAILLHLNENAIAASSGSACTTGSLEPSHVMRAMGLPYVLAHSSIRFSISRYNNESDIDKVIEVLPGIIDKLREISPFVGGR
ncbi:MAG: cysteine desulfurase NifS [Chitinispirillales bacterium]|nr:cysteine desulfurase NifS [Chitinispirillales bacterium]